VLLAFFFPIFGILCYMQIIYPLKFSF